MILPTSFAFAFNALISYCSVQKKKSIFSLSMSLFFSFPQLNRLWYTAVVTVSVFLKSSRSEIIDCSQVVFAESEFSQDVSLFWSKLCIKNGFSLWSLFVLFAFQNEYMKDDFFIKIETWHKPDMGTTENVSVNTQFISTFTSCQITQSLSTRAYFIICFFWSACSANAVITEMSKKH